MSGRGDRFERLKANLDRAFPLPATPMDQTGDERLDEILGLLRDERDRRAQQSEARDASRY